MRKAAIVAAMVLVSALLCGFTFGKKAGIESAFTVAELDKAANGYHWKVRIVSADKFKIHRMKEQKVLNSEVFNFVGTFDAMVEFSQDIPQGVARKGEVKKSFIPFFAQVVKENGAYSVKIFRIFGTFPYDMPDFEKERRQMVEELKNVRLQ